MTPEIQLTHSRRQILEAMTLPENDSHAGLWLDKFLENQAKLADKPESGEDALTTKLVKEVCGVGEPAGYESFFNRWQATLAQLGVEPRQVRVNGRLSIGLGRDGVIETGVALHHTYGVPVIPGSAIKGLASSYAHQYLEGTIWAKGKPAHETLFGTQERSGCVVFYDALPLPGEWKLEPDVMTVHHPAYYRGENKPPADWDNPVPIAFITVTGTFLMAAAPISKAASGWEGIAYGILKQALDQLGIGAKTSSGYGRLSFIESSVSGEEKKASAFLEQLAALENTNVATMLNSFVVRWKSDEIPPEAKKEVAQALLDKVDAAKRAKKSRGKRWFQELVECAENGRCPE